MKQKANPCEPEPSLEAKVALLRRRDSYPEHPAQVEAIETHMSWVFVTSRFAYKLKKPIRRGTLDYRALDARLLNCRREVELNRRLAPDVYLGVVPLTFAPDGRLHLDGVGRVVEWLVKMRRLPEDHTLQHAILAGKLDEAAVHRVASRLVRFFREAAPAPTGPAAYRRRFAKRIRDTRADLGRSAYGLRPDRLDRLCEAQLNFLATHPRMIGARARRIVEGHGDLRPEHIYLNAEPVVTDCLEFDRDLRSLDPLDELSFLAMECERLGAPVVGALLVEAYRVADGDPFESALVDFYACYSAFLRAKLAVWHLDEPGTSDPEKWRQRTDRYLEIADLHAREMLLSAPEGNGHGERRTLAHARGG
ncbi:MAG TPA: hypothetical protein VLB69_03415 [Rudaea sp.]|nr:hypothetical protein [Rudaea sp.]